MTEGSERYYQYQPSTYQQAPAPPAPKRRRRVFIWGFAALIAAGGLAAAGLTLTGSGSPAKPKGLYNMNALKASVNLKILTDPSVWGSGDVDSDSLVTSCSRLGAHQAICSLNTGGALTVTISNDGKTWTAES